MNKEGYYKQVPTYRVEITPQAQPRPRFARIGKGVRTYHPAKVGAYKAEIRRQVIAQGGRMMPEGPILLYVTFFMPRPKSHIKANGEVKKGIGWRHTVKPDLDNLEKGVIDALTGVLWDNDSQICSKYTLKRYAPAPGKELIVITAYGLTEEDYKNG